MSPRLSRVLDGICRVIPEIEALLLGGLQPAGRFAEIAELLVGKHRIDFARRHALDVLKRLEDAVLVRGFDAHAAF